MPPPSKKRREAIVKTIQRKSATRLGNDEFLDVFSVLCRDELEKLQITWRRFRGLVDQKMGNVCLRLLAEVSIRRKTFDGCPCFDIDIRPSGTEEVVRLEDVVETQLTKRLSRLFRHSAIDKFDLTCNASSLSKNFGAGLISRMAIVFENTRVIGDASFKFLCFGASSSLRSVTECFDEFSPKSLIIINCQGSRVTDADLLFLRDRGTQSIKIDCFPERSGDTISPDGVIQFCFHGDHMRRSFVSPCASYSYSLAQRLKPSFVHDLLQASRNCAHTNPMRIQFFAGAGAVHRLDVSEYTNFRNGNELRFPNEHVRINLPAQHNQYRLEFSAGADY